MNDYNNNILYLDINVAFGLILDKQTCTILKSIFYCDIQRSFARFRPAVHINLKIKNHLQNRWIASDAT